MSKHPLLTKLPVSKVDQLGPLERAPEKCMSEIFDLKAVSKIIQPFTGEVQDNPDIILANAEQEYKRMQKIQEGLLEKNTRQLKKNLLFRKELYKHQHFLRRSFIRINASIKSSCDRKHEAYTKIHNQQKEQKFLQNGIREMKILEESLNHFRLKLVATVEEYAPYEKIMEDIVNKLYAFESEKDCMDRCDAILCVQLEALNEMINRIKDMDRIRKIFVKQTKLVALKVLGMQNQLSELERQLSDANSQVHDYERKLGEMKATVANNELNKERAYDGLTVVYGILCKRNAVKQVFARGQVEEQLDYIKDELAIFTKIEQEFRRRHPDYEVINSAGGKPKC